MSKLDYFLLCENVVVDKSDRTSVINMFDNLLVTDLPSTHNKFVFTFRIIPDSELLDSKKVTFRLVVEDPSGKEYFSAEGVAPLAAHLKNPLKTKIASSLDISGFPIAQEGIHTAHLFVNGKVLGERKFEVKLQNGTV